MSNKLFEGYEKLSNPYNVKPGQTWEDNDKRSVRTLVINAVSIKYAYCTCAETKRSTRILLNRFNKNSKSGYTLKKDVK